VPSVKKYQSDSGYYIRSNIQGRFVTLQLSPEAEGLLSELGFQDGESISWQFLKPLCDSGHAYTNKSGTEVATDTIDTNGAVSVNLLNSEDQDRLEEFIAEHASDDGTGDDAGESDAGGDGSFDTTDIGGHERGFIQKWSPSDEEYEATLNRIARADDSAGVVKSVAHHGTEHPMSPERFRVSSQGIPTYSFETGAIAWTVHDYRTVRSVATDAELFFDIRPGTAKAQSITITTDSPEWHTKRERFTAEQIEDFVTVAPEILYYAHHLVSSPTVDPKEIINAADAEVPSAEADRVDALTTIQPVDPAEYVRAIGLVLTFGEKEYGRIRSHTGHTFKFNGGDVESESVEPGDIVTFDVKHNRGSVWADEIRLEDIGVSGSAIITRWPDWHDRSVTWIREHWAEDEMQKESSSDAIMLPSENETEQYETLTVAADLLPFYLALNRDETAETVDTAIRTLLKNSIDGELPSPRSPVVTKEIDISLPRNLVLMIESVVETAPEYRSRAEFVNTALQQHVADGKEEEMTVRIPLGYQNVAEQLAEDRDMSTAEFVQAAVENLIGTELNRKL